MKPDVLGMCQYLNLASDIRTQPTYLIDPRTLRVAVDRLVVIHARFEDAAPFDAAVQLALVRRGEEKTLRPS